MTRLAAGAGIALVLVTTGAAQQPSETPPPDGLLRSELSLVSYTVTLAYPPALAWGGETFRVRTGHLETNGPLRIGSTAIGRPQRAVVRHDLWLKGTSDSWTLELTDVVSADGGADPAVIAEIPLAREAAALSSSFTAALLPETGRAARLVLRWGANQASTDVTFTVPPRAQRVNENRGANVTVNRKHDEDTSVLSRARLLAQRNETAVVAPTGQRLSISFQRTFDADELRAAGGSGRTRGLPVDGPDFARLQSTPNGSVVVLAEAAVPRLRVERPLRFGNAVIAIGNQVPGFPGSYGVWLKRAGSGWKVVFNHEPDAWGSQHDPKFDAAEVDVEHSEGHAAARPFAAALVPDGPDRGRLLIIWGPHEWSADFTVAD